MDRVMDKAFNEAMAKKNAEEVSRPSILIRSFDNRHSQENRRRGEPNFFCNCENTCERGYAH